MTPARPDVVGLLAGNLGLPLSAARAVKDRGGRLVVVGIAGETDPAVYRLADASLETPLGRLGETADFFLAEGAGRICLAGGVSRGTVIGGYDPDEDAVRVMEALESFQTDSILRAAAGYFEGRGLRVLSVAELIPELLAGVGRLAGPLPDPDLWEDLRLAYRLAKELGRLDCGQTVVVSDKIAVALEGADGTDATIRRGASLCRKPVAVAKVVKPNQDFRLDLPVIGPETVSVLAGCRAGALALDSGGLIVLDGPECLRLAEEAGLAVLGWRSDPGPWPGADSGPDSNSGPDPGADSGTSPGPSHA